MKQSFFPEEMDKKAIEKKLEEWRIRLKDLEETQLPNALQRLKDAAEGGDWEDNAEYEDSERQVELLQVRIAEIKQIVKKLEKDAKH